MTDHSHLQDALTWAYNNMAPIGIAVGGVVGSITWACNEFMLKRFATVEALQRCRDQTVQGFQQAIHDHEERSLEREMVSHTEIKLDISSLSNNIISVESKLDQLKNMLLQKEWSNK